MDQYGYGKDLFDWLQGLDPIDRNRLFDLYLLRPDQRPDPCSRKVL